MALGFWGIGAATALWCVRDFYSKGRGTPAPVDPPKRLVVCGLYRYTRNPMYIGILLILTGHILWFESLSLITYLFFLAGLFHLFVIGYEEPHLKKIFGKPYLDYAAQVPRWIPRLRPGSKMGSEI